MRCRRDVPKLARGNDIVTLALLQNQTRLCSLNTPRFIIIINSHHPIEAFVFVLHFTSNLKPYLTRLKLRSPLIRSTVYLRYGIIHILTRTR